MAELQWVIEVRCVNALLAQIKVGERGQHFIVEVPAGDFDPSEFGKLIDGVEEAKAIGDEHYSKLLEKTKVAVKTTQPSFDSRVIEDRDLHDIQLLGTGELAIVKIKNSFFAPSELERFLGDLKKAKQQMDTLRRTRAR
jgi:GDP-D-mannose dehydratase